MQHTTLYDWFVAGELKKLDVSFCGALAYLVLKADNNNRAALQRGWPGLIEEVQARYDAPGGAITDEEKNTVARFIEDGRINVFGQPKKSVLTDEGRNERW